MVKVYFFVDVPLEKMQSLKKMKQYVMEEVFATEAEAKAFVMALNVVNDDLTQHNDCSDNEQRYTFADFSMKGLFKQVLVEIEETESVN